MIGAVITAAVMCSVALSSGGPQRRPACWDGRLSGTRRNRSCTVQIFDHVEGGQSCLCPTGFWTSEPDRNLRDTDASFPSASQPFLMFCHGKSIHRIGLDGRNQRRLVSPVGSSILLDFHFKGESIFWADRRTGVIYRASVRAARRQKLHSFDKHISGLAVDWIGNFVYWTSEEKGEVRRMDTNGKNERTLLRNLTKPSSISVDPTSSHLSLETNICRFLFWLSRGMVSSVQRSDEGGRIIRTLLTSAEQLKALTIDRQHRRLFWAQFSLQGESAIASCDYDGKVLHVMDLPLQSHSFAMSLFREHLYYTDARTHVVKRLNKYTGGEPLEVNIKPNTKVPVALKVVHPLNQPMTQTLFQTGCNEQSGVCVNVCSSLAEPAVCQCGEGFSLSKQGSHCEDVNECAHWNHGCSLGCENIPGSYFCTCPKGYGLLPDRKTCRGESLNSRSPPGPPPSLLVANLVDVRVISADGGGDQTLVREPRGSILAVDYDPLQKQVKTHPLLLCCRDSCFLKTLECCFSVLSARVFLQVYFASSAQKTIERVHLSGGSRDLLVADGLHSPEGLAVDWVHRRMYWTDSSKSTVDGSTLDGLDRETVVREKLERPKGITVHPLEKKLIWTDVGSRPVVEASSLEGGDRAVIASSGLVAPTGLTIDFTENRVFWCDQKRGVIESAGLDGSDRRVLSENQVGQPFDLAVFEDRLWVSDWEQQLIRTVHKRTGKNLQWTHSSFLLPASVVVLHDLAKPGADACLHLNGGCAQVCDSEEGVARCSCLPAFVLSTDGKTCSPVHGLDAGGGAEPDLFTNKMISDQSECHALRCDVNARCLQHADSASCWCLQGFTGDGHTCVELEASWVTTTSPIEERTRHQNWSSAQRCPSSHEAYCLYQGVCLYYPEMEAYACNCVPGYMGERCQFSDLEWLELQRAEKEKRKNVTIAACAVVLLSLLALIACVTYCFRTRRLLYKGSSVDDVSEISVAEDTMCQSTTTSLPKFCPAAERRVAPSDSPETDRGSLSKRIGYQSPAAPTVVMETTQLDINPSSPSQSSSCSSSSSSFQDPF
ncbi:pro-epidermal growth factor [Oryzias melastigma]|uniref:pro-epidermal growth factor n=1 Tax=Oryzias melastigma TaxID=30732 RepID=UPI00168CBC3D|nr:pro-epidermal growth factor [Oryzias melastigma]